MREAGAHLSQALEEGAGAATRRGFLWGVGGMWLKGVTERKSLAHAPSVPLKHYLSSAYPGKAPTQTEREVGGGDCA